MNFAQPELFLTGTAGRRVGFRPRWANGGLEAHAAKVVQFRSPSRYHLAIVAPILCILEGALAS